MTKSGTGTWGLGCGNVRDSAHGDSGTWGLRDVGHEDVGVWEHGDTGM